MPEDLRIGIIGFDTSHVTAFTKLLNDASDPFHVPGGKVVAGLPTFSADIESSISRVDGYQRELTGKYGVTLAASVEDLVGQVDAVLLESLDGRRHLVEAAPVIRAGKPLFIDKPLAASYADAAAIVRLAQEHNCPLFSSSSLRFDANIVRLKEETGALLSCDAFGPASLEPTNPGLFWYGIHAVEILYTFMGPGCRKVRCHHKAHYDVVVGDWEGDRLATLRGTRRGAADYGATVFGEKKVAQTTYSRDIPIYSQLLKQIVPFFHGAPAPVAPAETLEIMAFIQAALISEREEREVTLAEVM